MRSLRRNLGLGVVLLLLGSASAHGQPSEPPAAMESECVLALRDGTTIRAQVVEYLPGSHVILRVFDGQTFRLPIEQVLNITHPGDGPLPPSPACLRRPRVMRAPTPDAEPSSPVPIKKPEPLPQKSPAPDTPPATGPVVNLLSDRPGADLERSTGTKMVKSTYRGRTSVRWEYEWAQHCAFPCGVRLAEEGIYRIAGNRFSPSAPFRLESFERGPFNLRLRMGPKATHDGGLASVVLGTLSGLAGAGILIWGATSTPSFPVAGTPPADLVDYRSAQAAQRAELAVGGVLLGTGIAAIIGGAFLLRRGKTQVTIERPSDPPEPPSP